MVLFCYTFCCFVIHFVIFCYTFCHFLLYILLFLLYILSFFVIHFAVSALKNSLVTKKAPVAEVVVRGIVTPLNFPIIQVHRAA